MITPEQIQQNWQQFEFNIKHYISQERADKLWAFYKKHEDRFIMMPASHKV